MEWKYIKKLTDNGLIGDFEITARYAFTEDFKKCVIENNGGRPSKKTFDTAKTKERAIKSLLSFNKEDKETVWNIFKWNKEELRGKYIPFAIDNYGNIICFDKNNNHVVFINHENLDVEEVANNFTDFLSVLYE